MNKFTNTMKYIPVLILALGLFIVTKPVFAVECWTNEGPAWMNCNYGGNDNNNNNDDDNDNNDNDNLNVSTLSETNVDEDSATLRGDITSLDESEDYERYFEWGTDEDDLDHTASVSGTTDNEGTFSKTISNLNDDTEYFYRACAEEVDGNDDDCGSVHSLTTDEDNGNSNNDDDDDDNDNGGSDSDGAILTTDASNVTSTSAVINGVVTNDSGSQTVWFEWGSTVNLGNRTASRFVSSHQSIVSAQIFGLTPGRAYFFRLVSNNGEEGDYRAFVTSSGSVVQNTNTNTNTNTNNNNDDSSSDEDEDESEDESDEDGPNVVETVQYFDIELVPSAKDVAPGSTVSIEVVYENLHNSALRNLVITVDFPPGLTPTDSEMGEFISDRKIEVMIPAFAAYSKANFTIEAEVYEKLANDNFLVTVVEAHYDHPVQANTRIESVNSSIMKVSNNVAVRGGASGNGNQSANAGGSGSSFFPKSIIGWLILTGGIALVIILANLIYKKKEIKKTNLKIAR